MRRRSRVAGLPASLTLGPTAAPPACTVRGAFSCAGGGGLLASVDRVRQQMRREEIIAGKAKANEKAGGQKAGRGRPAQGLAKLPNPIAPTHTRRECAKAAGLGDAIPQARQA